MAGAIVSQRPMPDENTWCPCHGFGGQEVVTALTEGAETVAQIFRHIGVCAKCGDCVPKIRDTLRETRVSRYTSPLTEKEPNMSTQTKVKIAVMLDDGDKLEYEAHVSDTNLEAAKAEAEKRMRAAVTALSGKGESLKADRVKIETH
jgi:NAD(P)H-nitrite reductase large subunit